MACDIIAGESPVAARVEVAEVQFPLDSQANSRHRLRDFARHKGLPPPRRFVVEQNSAGGVQAITFPVIHRHLVREGLGAGIWAARVENGSLALRGKRATEHLAGRGLIKPARKSIAPDGFEQADRAQRHHVGGVLRNVEAYFDVALGAEIVDLIRADLRQTPGQGAGIVQVRIVQKELRSRLVNIYVQVVHAFGIQRRRPPLQAVDLIALRAQELGQIRAILPGNASNQGFRHFAPSTRVL